jgi:hypothetical protein
MLDFTQKAEVDGRKFDGVDLFLSVPHTSIDASDDELRALADNVGRRGLVIGSLVAPVWPPTGGGSAMGNETERAAFLTQVKKACKIGKKLREIGIRKYGIIRIDSASGVEGWSKDPAANQKTIAATFRAAGGHRQGPRRTPRRRRRDLLGRHAQLEANGRTARVDRPQGRDRLPG